MKAALDELCALEEYLEAEVTRVFCPELPLRIEAEGRSREDSGLCRKLRIFFERDVDGIQGNVVSPSASLLEPPFRLYLQGLTRSAACRSKKQEDQRSACTGDGKRLLRSNRAKVAAVLAPHQRCESIRLVSMDFGIAPTI